MHFVYMQLDYTCIIQEMLKIEVFFSKHFEQRKSNF